MLKCTVDTELSSKLDLDFGVVDPHLQERCTGQSSYKDDILLSVLLPELYKSRHSSCGHRTFLHLQRQPLSLRHRPTSIPKIAAVVQE